MTTPNLRAALLAGAALACSPQTNETAGETAPTGSTTDPGTTAPTTDPGTTAPTTDPGTTAPTTADTGEPPSACALEPVSTECDNDQLGYYFDPAAMKCRSFWHGTCGGEVVPFESETACQSECEPCETLLGEPTPLPDGAVTFRLRNASAAPIFLRPYTPDDSALGYNPQIFSLLDAGTEQALVIAVNECSLPCAAFDNPQCGAGCGDGPLPPPIVIHPGGTFTSEWHGLNFDTAALPERCLPAACEPGLECGRWFSTPAAEYMVSAVVATQWECEGPDCSCDGNPDGWCQLPSGPDLGGPIDPQELGGWLFYPADDVELVFE